MFIIENIVPTDKMNLILRVPICNTFRYEIKNGKISVVSSYTYVFYEVDIIVTFKQLVKF